MKKDVSLKENIKKLREKKLSYDEISKILGINKSTISYHSTRLDLNKPINNKSKISEETFFKIKSLEKEKNKSELIKCMLVCSNCHREIHHPNMFI